MYYNRLMTTKDKRLFLIANRKTYEFYLTTNSLQDRAPMKAEREEPAIAYEPTLDRIYVMGGKISKSSEYYDINKDQWTLFSSFKQKIWRASASILNNRFIYLFGGRKFVNLHTILKYDIRDN